MSDFNDRVISEFRANGGRVEHFGDSLIILHTVGAKSGQPRQMPLMAITQPDGSWLIAASKAGAPDNPAWYANLVANSRVTVETGTETVEAIATVLQGDDRDAGWTQFEALGGSFAGYQASAGDRVIPVVRLSAV